MITTISPALTAEVDPLQGLEMAERFHHAFMSMIGLRHRPLRARRFSKTATRRTSGSRIRI